jgi:hypothetical protein
MLFIYIACKVLDFKWNLPIKYIFIISALHISGVASYEARKHVLSHRCGKKWNILKQLLYLISF